MKRRMIVSALAPCLLVCAASAATAADAAPDLLERGVAQIDAHKLLIPIDGLAVRRPLFSGVCCETQATDLDSVGRIESVRGPGAF